VLTLRAEHVSRHLLMPIPFFCFDRVVLPTTLRLTIVMSASNVMIRPVPAPSAVVIAVGSLTCDRQVFDCAQTTFNRRSHTRPDRHPKVPRAAQNPGCNSSSRGLVLLITAWRRARQCTNSKERKAGNRSNLDHRPSDPAARRGRWYHGFNRYGLAALATFSAWSRSLSSASEVCASDPKYRRSYTESG
jgi:hypothetical protein